MTNENEGYRITCCMYDTAATSAAEVLWRWARHYCHAWTQTTTQGQFASDARESSLANAARFADDRLRHAERAHGIAEMGGLVLGRHHRSASGRVEWSVSGWECEAGVECGPVVHLRIGRPFGAVIQATWAPGHGTPRVEAVVLNEWALVRHIWTAHDLLVQVAPSAPDVLALEARLREMGCEEVDA